MVTIYIEEFESHSCVTTEVKKGNNVEKDTLENVFNQLKNAEIDNSSELNINKLTCLKLVNCNLTDLPHELKSLNLKTCDLSNNKLKVIPKCFYSGLNKLVNMDLSINYIECFDFEPACVGELKFLNLEKNKLTHIPRWILALRATNLSEFNYSLNKMSLIRCIFGSQNLSITKLVMQNCVLRNVDCNFFKNCKQLEYLDVSNKSHQQTCVNIFRDIDILFVKPTWSWLTVLKLNHLGLSVFPEGITWIESLYELYLLDNDLSWLPEHGLEFLVNLEVFDVSQNHICKIPDKLVWLEGLRTIKAANNIIEIIPDFSKSHSLETLDLFGNKLREFNCDLSKLKFLDLESNYFDTVTLCPAYEQKKKKYREVTNQIDIRGDGPNINLECESDSSSGRYRSYTSDDDSLLGDTKSISVCMEDWDEELLDKARNHDISPSDDEWKGFEDNYPPIVELVYKPKVYNEDWMFCDAEES